MIPSLTSCILQAASVPRNRRRDNLIFETIGRKVLLATAPEQERMEVGTARCAVPARIPAGGRNVVCGPSAVIRFRRLTLRWATGTAQRAVPTRATRLRPGGNGYLAERVISHAQSRV